VSGEASSPRGDGGAQRGQGIGQLGALRVEVSQHVGVELVSSLDTAAAQPLDVVAGGPA
jgi:hypothetical protein